MKYEFKITVARDWDRETTYVAQVWLREWSSPTEVSAWRLVITRDYNASFRDVQRPRALFQGVAKTLSR